MAKPRIRRGNVGCAYGHEIADVRGARLA
jgi:hypothetical protein